ncbi:hypothetical protein H4582DRAFT_2087712 [Lactarius indigo]|nr:hypothetical protein H4582DRAFT_2087712 [Lactarius indigo]
MSTILKHAASAVRTPFSHKGPALCALTRPVPTQLRWPLARDLYLKELDLQGPPAAKDAHVGAVKAFSAPSSPSVPALPDLATELAAYDATEPTRADATDVSPAHGGSAAGAEAYLAFLEADEVQEEAHH